MNYDNQIKKIFSSIKKNDDQGFINLIKDLDEKKEFIPLYQYLEDEWGYEYLQQLKKKLMDIDETLNIFASNFPNKIWYKVVTDYKIKSRIKKDLIPKILFVFSQDYDDIGYFIEFLEKAINEKDDEMIKGFYDIFMNNISYNQKTMMIDSRTVKTAQKLIDENYNSYSTEILKSLLNIYEGQKEDKNIKKIIEQNYEKNISSIKPVFKEIIFDYVDSKDKLYGKKVVMFDKDKKYSMNYDYFVRNLIYSSKMFFKEGEKYYMGKFLADKLDVKECFLPRMFVTRRKENVNIFEVMYGKENKVNFDIRFEDNLHKQKEMINDIINRINKCSYGFQPLGIGIIDKSRKISSAHAGFSFFEKIGNNINIYYYEPHGTNEITSSAHRMGMPDFLKYLVQQINKLYPELNIKIDFKYSGCLHGLQSYVGKYDIGMCESWTFFWMFLVSKTLDYIKKNNINLTIEEWLPLIEKYFTEEVEEKKVYNLLISFISQLYLEFNNENKAFNSHIKKLLRDYYLKPKFIKAGFEEGIVIEDITGREIYELEKMKKEYKEYVNKLAVLKEDFLKRQEAFKDVKRTIKEEEKKVSEKQGKKLFENCNVDLECATKCCKTMGRAKICVPEKECKIRHIYGKGFK
jgi:hypothetical protein